MIPSSNPILTTNLQVAIQASRQHRMDLDKGRILGTCDGLEAVRQSIYKILNTERYRYIIYSWNYGIELTDLYGKPTAYACPEIARRVKEALVPDDRITGVDAFAFDTSKRGVISVSFTVHTVWGELSEEMAVNI